MLRPLGTPLLLAALLLVKTARAEPVVLEGTLGSKRIRAELEIEKGVPRLGEYFYVGNDRTLDLLPGSDGAGHPLTESDPESGDETGRWEITVQADRITGTWSDPGGEKKLPIALERSRSDPVESLPLESWKRVWGKTRACSFEARTLARSFVQTGGAELARALRDAQTRLMDNLAAEPCLYPEERGEGDPPVNGSYEVECATEALRVRGRFVSIHWDCSGEARENDTPVGAHPTNERHALLFDLETRKTLELGDWVTLASVEGEAVANGIYLAPLGIKLFFIGAPHAMVGYTDTLPYAGLAKNLERIGEPTGLAAKLDF